MSDISVVEESLGCPLGCAARVGRCRARAAIELTNRRLSGFEEGDDGEDPSVDVGGGGDFELGEDVLDVLFDRAVGYPEGLGDPGVRLSLGHERNRRRRAAPSRHVHPDALEAGLT